MPASGEAVLAGGPKDDEVIEVGNAGLVMVEVDGTLHRYVSTMRRRSVGGTDLPVYTYDGVVTGEDD